MRKVVAGMRKADSSASRRNDNSSQGTENSFFRGSRLLLVAGVMLAAPVARGQASDPNAVHWAQMAVETQLHSDATDHSPWMYRDHDVQPGKDTLADVVESPRGDVQRVIERFGKPLTASQTEAETARIRAFVEDPEAQAKQKKSAAHDEAQATEVLRMLPQAFVWTIASETPELVTLKFVPNPKFSAPSMAAKVMAQMSGEMVVTRQGAHLRTLKGQLMNDVWLGFGLVRLKAGGTFDVERREVGPGHWQVVEQHTHIDGHAFLLKTVGEQEDEVKTGFKPSPAQSPAEAERLLGAER